MKGCSTERADVSLLSASRLSSVLQETTGAEEAESTLAVNRLLRKHSPAPTYPLEFVEER